MTLVTGQSELEGHLLVPYSTKANAFCELGREIKILENHAFKEKYTK